MDVVFETLKGHSSLIVHQILNFLYTNKLYDCFLQERFIDSVPTQLVVSYHSIQRFDPIRSNLQIRRRDSLHIICYQNQY